MRRRLQLPRRGYDLLEELFGVHLGQASQELGRLVKNLEKAGELDNTLILFFSDNGACPYDRRHTDMDRQPYEPDVTWGDSTGWSWARNSPFRYYKQNHQKHSRLKYPN